MGKADAANRFRLTPTNRHVHNNTDAPFVFLPYQIYGGFVPYDGDVNGVLEAILPRGWTVTYNGAGSYSIFHNLGTFNYIVVATASQSTNVVVACVSESFENQVDFNWFDTSSANQDTSFNFILILLNGNSATFPTYVTQNVR